MRFKRNLVLSIMSLMLLFSAIVAYAAEIRDYDRCNPGDGRATLEAYAYINESGWGRHTGKATGSLYGDDKYAAGNYRVEAYYGDYEPDTWSDKSEEIGFTYKKYVVNLEKTGWFDSVYCDIYDDGDYDPDNILLHAEVED